MVFLNPTILLGLLAASIPVILHFLNLRKIKKIEFSTLAFLKELQKSKIRKIKIKQLLLLLIRILIIAFLVLSFARPTLESSTLGGISSYAKKTAIIIIDNSFSMSVIDEKGSFLNQSKTIVTDLLSSFQSGDDVHIILTSEQDNSQFQKVDNIEISYKTVPLSNSILAAEDLIKNSNNINKEVYVFSDFQKSTFFESDSLNNVFSFTDTRFYLFHFEKEPTENLSLTDVQIDNQIFELNKTVTINSEATNFTEVRSYNKLSSLFFNGKRVAQKSLSVAGKSTNNTLFKATTDKTGVIKITASLEDDDIKYDNRFYSYIIIPEKVKVLLVGKFEDEFLFIKSAIKSNSGTTIDFRYVNPKNLSQNNLENYNTLIITGSYGDSFSETIKSYVSNGGNIILFPSNKCNIVEENKLLSKLNIPRVAALSKSNDNLSINSFNKIDFTHPIFEGIFTKQNSEIESPSFNKYLKFTTQGSGYTIISQQDNSSFLSEYKFNNGIILFFNVAPNLEWSNLPLKNIFAPLINRSINYLSSNYSKDEGLLAGDVLSVNISQRKSNQIKVIKPDGSNELININSKKDNYLNYGNSNLVGIYSFYSNNILLDIKAVNYNSIESDLTPIPIDTFSKTIQNESNTILDISSSDDYKTKISVSQNGSELWQLFLIIALLLALLEMYIARSSKKDLAEL